ncbi:MAG TPA: ATPase, T2SS/T4P/T4SS family [Polyangia bacterium]
MDSFFDRALAAARRLGASDVHLKPGQSPILRIAGELRTFTDVPALSRDFLQSLALSLLSDRRREALERTGDVTVVFATAAGRQRVHIFQQRSGLGLSLRLIPAEIPKLDTLGLPSEIRELTDAGGGLILVAAGPGNGKTTTLSAIIDDVGARRTCRVLSIEDPAEYLHRRTSVVQREVGTDAPTAAAALRAAARQDAELVAVDPLGDLETAELALAAAETGQLVLAGVAAGSATGAIGRLTRFWAPEARAETRARIAAALQGVVFQRLVTAADGKRRTAAGELLRVLPETRGWILDGTVPVSEGAQEVPGRTPFEPAPPAGRRRRGATAEAQPAVEDDAEPD